MRGKHFDTIIIGGGVIGCSIAFHLSKKGYQVLLLEGNKIASESSRAAAGMLAVQAELDVNNPLYGLAQRSRDIFSTLSEELKEITGRDIMLRSNGMLKIAQTLEDVKVYQEIAKQQQTIQEEAAWLEKDELLKLEPSLSENHFGGLFFPKESHVSALELTIALSEAAIEYGARIKEGCRVESIQTGNGKFRSVVTNYGSYTADHVVIATGAWSNKWLPNDSDEERIYPVKGEAMLVKANPTPIKKTIFGNGCYIVPKKGGELLIGATMKPYTFNKAVTLGGISSLMDKATSILPALTEAEIIDMWAGIRPMTSDELPVVGEHPEIDGVILAAGHFRNGILLSPITGELVTNLISGDIAENDIHRLEALSPSRFYPETYNNHIVKPNFGRKNPIVVGG